MMRKATTLLASVFASGMMLGAPAGAGAHSMYGEQPGCCGPVKPVYHHHDAYKSYSVDVHVPVYKTVHFERPRQVYNITHLHVTKYIHRIIDTHVTRVGYIRDYPHYAVYPTLRVVTDTVPGVTTVHCICGPYGSGCQ